MSGDTSTLSPNSAERGPPNKPIDAAPRPLPGGLPWIAAAVAVAAAVSWLLTEGLAGVVCALAAAAAVTGALALAQRAADSSRSVVIAALLVAAGLLVPVGLGSGAVPAIILATATQIVATVSLPRGFALASVLVTAAAAAAGVAPRGGTEAWVAGAAVLAINAAIAHALMSLLQAADDQRQLSERAHLQRSPLAGPTRVELERIKREFGVLTGELRRETSERQNAEARLLEAFRTKEAFLATMSHELRTPLSQIIGYSELIVEEAEESDPTELVADVERIHQAAMGLFDILDNVLDQSRIEAGMAEARPEPIELFGFIDLLVRNFAAQARRRNNTLRVRCAESIGVIVTDRGKLHTILKNLLGNACKFTEGGTIRISVELRDENGMPIYVFAVSDTGIGIHPDHMGRLFQPFQQVDGSPTRRYDGPGLGLAVSRYFAAMLGGDLTAESEPGAGSTFTVRLPQEWFDGKRAGVIVRSFGG